jgi:hypothetical protein
MLFGDRDQAATDEPDMTCPSPDVIRGHLADFRIEHWEEKEEDGHTALGEPHHFHLIEVVAVRLGDMATRAAEGDSRSASTGDGRLAMDASTGGRAVG